jgi:hypothetical protein
LVSSVRTNGKDEKKEEIHPPDVERVNMVTRGRLLNVVAGYTFLDGLYIFANQANRSHIFF